MKNSNSKLLILLMLSSLIASFTRAQVPILNTDFLILDTLVNKHGIILFEPYKYKSLFFIDDSIHIPKFRKYREFMEFLSDSGTLVLERSHFHLISIENHIKTLCPDSLNTDININRNIDTFFVGKKHWIPFFKTKASFYSLSIINKSYGFYFNYEVIKKDHSGKPYRAFGSSCIIR